MNRNTLIGGSSWQRLLDPENPSVMGILNVTPDSFSDGGRFNTVEAAVVQAAQMLSFGAEILDVGGESTRPGASPVSVQEELDRVIPVVERLFSEFGCALSVDTSTPQVMREAVEAGACMVNDVRALEREGALQVAAELSVPVCLMHMQGSPETMQLNPDYSEVVDDVIDYLYLRKQACLRGGISEAHILVDPGFGFGKKLEHNLALLANLNKLHCLNSPILIGVSRKSMFGQLLGREVSERLAGTIAATVVAAQKGCAIMRVHDVREAVDAITLVKAMREYSDE